MWMLFVLQDASDVGLVQVSTAQAIDRRLLRAERHDELETELGSVDRLRNQSRHSLFYSNRIHHANMSKRYPAGGHGSV